MARLGTPVAAGLAGIAFAVIISTVLGLMRSVVTGAGDPSNWLDVASERNALRTSLALIPYAGIAFLWFIGVIRAHLGDREDRLFATAFLGSGLLLVAMLFTAAAVMGALLLLSEGAHPPSTDSTRLAGAVTRILLGDLGLRMAAVFTLVVTNLGRRTGIVPRWLLLVGYVSGIGLLLAPPRSLWVAMLFPAWVFLFSAHILLTSVRAKLRGGSGDWVEPA